MAPIIKEADRRELTVVSGPDIHDTLARSIGFSGETIVAEKDGEMLALGGVAKAGAVAIPWLVTTEGALRYGKRLVKDTRPVVARWAQQYGKLENFVQKTNTVSRAWLARLGFKEEEAPWFHPEFLRVTRCAT